MKETGRILVVDDEPEVLDYTAEILRRQGHEVVTASSIQDGVALAKTETFNVIVTDLEMPDLSWEELPSTFLDLQPHTPVIVLSEQATADQADRIMKKGAFDVLMKPIDHKRLVKWVLKALSYSVKDFIPQEKRILVVDDEPVFLEGLSDLLQRQGYQVDTAASGDEALEKVKDQKYHLILTDLEMPGRLSWHELLQSLEELLPETPKILLTAHGMIQGQHDWIDRYKMVQDLVLKPYASKDLLRRVYQALRVTDSNADPGLPKTQSAGQESDEIVHNDPLMKKLLEKSEIIAKTDLPVLLTGESGTGKEVIARFIHRRSDRASMPFVAVNCAAIPTELFESEFFGHVRGAFTSAHADRKGLFEAAHGGTIFLDEVGEIAPENQVKLLRVLQEDEVKRVGEQMSRPIDARLICATNSDLKVAVREGRFRSDLYYRIKVIPVLIPPLRERPGDILPLAEHFIDFESRRPGSGVIKRLTSSAQEKLASYSWPGNVRELKNAIRQAVLLSAGEWIDVDDLMLEEDPVASVAARGPGRPSSVEPSRAEEPVGNLPEGATQGGSADAKRGGKSLREERRDWMKNYLENLLREVDGNISRAAEKSGKHRSELYQLISRYDIDLSRFRTRTMGQSNKPDPL